MRRFLHAGHYHGVNYCVECQDGINVIASVVINNQEVQRQFSIKNLAFDWVKQTLKDYDKSMADSMEQHEIE